jgi:hypothetical protein
VPAIPGYDTTRTHRRVFFVTKDAALTPLDDNLHAVTDKVVDSSGSEGSPALPEACRVFSAQTNT